MYLQFPWLGWLAGSQIVKPYYFLKVMFNLVHVSDTPSDGRNNEHSKVNKNRFTAYNLK